MSLDNLGTPIPIRTKLELAGSSLAKYNHCKQNALASSAKYSLGFCSFRLWTELDQIGLCWTLHFIWFTIVHVYLSNTQLNHSKTTFLFLTFLCLERKRTSTGLHKLLKFCWNKLCKGFLVAQIISLPHVSLV